MLDVLLVTAEMVLTHTEARQGVDQSLPGKSLQGEGVRKEVAMDRVPC